ncbi:hypothetical protein P8C59_005432 [Phyllachora maydis]|uniref:Uncharacterized protein n=1 Tax=Phyllachora maydis TaxID=1825666 RepID=A0AAD9I5J5_9PEZI|nr:hypothetical protein P8C59_005432 [Phyllachora maydis]
MATDDMGRVPRVPPSIVDIAVDGDVVLDVLFCPTSPDTLRAALRVGYRVRLAALRTQSKYFDRLLGDTRFREAKSVELALHNLAARRVPPAQAGPPDLPLVPMVVDDESSRSAAAALEPALGDLMRLLHAGDVATKPVTLAYVAVLAVLADRFDCTAVLAARTATSLRFKWPVTSPQQARGVGPDESDGGLTRAAEDALRQKTLVAWLLGLPLQLHAATRELVVYGSRQWSAFADESDARARARARALPRWWELQDGLEAELEHRRACLLNAIGSVQAHFLRLYSSRSRQCLLGYDSSASCDSYQLGEMVRFLASRGLLFLVDYSAASLDKLPGQAAAWSVDRLLATLKQCPGYQIDKNHTNCGMRTRILPILEFLQSMLATNVLSISLPAWRKDRGSASWLPAAADPPRSDDEKAVFRFTRALAADQRLRYQGAMAAEGIAKAVFTAHSWDWTPDD